MQNSQRDIQEKLDRFRQSIMRQADGRIQTIEGALEEHRAAEIGKYKDDARGDSDHLLEEEKRRIETAAARAVSARRNELRRKLYERRAALTEQLFSEARERLSSFVQSAEYPAFLCQKAKKAAALRRGGPVLLRVRPVDLQWKDDLITACGLPCRVEADEEISLGGLRFVLEQSGAESDETLDAALAAQRQWFYENAGLYLTRQSGERGDLT